MPQVRSVSRQGADQSDELLYEQRVVRGPAPRDAAPVQRGAQRPSPSARAAGRMPRSQSESSLRARRDDEHRHRRGPRSGSARRARGTTDDTAMLDASARRVAPIEAHSPLVDDSAAWDASMLVPFKPLGTARHHTKSELRPSQLAKLASMTVGDAETLEAQTERERDAMWLAEERERQHAYTSGRGGRHVPPTEAKAEAVREKPARRRRPKPAAWPAAGPASDFSDDAFEDAASHVSAPRRRPRRAGSRDAMCAPHEPDGAERKPRQRSTSAPHTGEQRGAQTGPAAASSTHDHAQIRLLYDTAESPPPSDLVSASTLSRRSSDYALQGRTPEQRMHRIERERERRERLEREALERQAAARRLAEERARAAEEQRQRENIALRERAALEREKNELERRERQRQELLQQQQ